MRRVFGLKQRSLRSSTSTGRLLTSRRRPKRGTRTGPFKSNGRQEFSPSGGQHAEKNPVRTRGSKSKLRDILTRLAERREAGVRTKKCRSRARKEVPFQGISTLRTVVKEQRLTGDVDKVGNHEPKFNNRQQQTFCEKKGVHKHQKQKRWNPWLRSLPHLWIAGRQGNQDTSTHRSNRT